MIDTTSINYAMDKISNGWAKVAPTIADIGEKYVRFVVMREVILAVIAALLLVAAIIFLARGLSMIRSTSAKKDGWDEPSASGVLGIAFTVIGCIGIIGGIVSTFTQGYHAALAITNPEMYTVQTVIESAKGRP